MSDWTEEEKEILEAYEAGTLEEVPHSNEEAEGYRAAARGAGPRQGRTEPPES